MDLKNVVIYDKAPILVYWELTRSCDLACKHCRAEAIFKRHPMELSYEEACANIDKIATFPRKPMIVFTGGDPLHYPYLEELIQYASTKSVPVSLAPSATVNLSTDFLKRVKRYGVKVISLSLDGHNSESHDNFRQVEGCFDDTIKAANMIKDANLPLQVNTLVCRETYDSLEHIYNMLSGWSNVIRWSVFFLIQTGRGAKLHSITPEEAEETMEWINTIAHVAHFDIKTTEAPSYRRVVYQKNIKEGSTSMPVSVVRGAGIRDGNGIMFISHTGDVYPSGFLPVVAGNIREKSPVDIYQNTRVFTQIRNPNLYKGKCGYCEFRNLCGGSRARAYGWTGDFLGSDPLCTYKPAVPENSTVVA